MLTFGESEWRLYIGDSLYYFYKWFLCLKNEIIKTKEKNVFDDVFQWFLTK